MISQQLFSKLFFGAKFREQAPAFEESAQRIRTAEELQKLERDNIILALVSAI